MLMLCNASCRASATPLYEKAANSFRVRPNTMLDQCLSVLA